MRDQGVETLRFVAASLIIYWHIPVLTAGPLISWSLPAFVAISILYGRMGAQVSFGSYLCRLGQRLVIPWLLWSVFYIAVRSAFHYQQIGSWASTIAWTDLLVGGVLPLWYLPFIFGVLTSDAAIQCGVRHCARSDTASWCVAAAYLVLGSVSAGFCGELRSAPVPFPQYGSVLPATMLCLSLISIPSAKHWAPRIGVVVAMVALAVWFGFDVVPSIAGLGSVVLLKGRWKGEKNLPIWMGRLSWPMYLVHPVFIALALRMFDSGLLVFAFTMVASMFVSWVLVRDDRVSGLVLQGRLGLGKRVVM